MIRRDLKNNIGVAQTLAPKARTASEDGGGVDLRGFRGATAIWAAGLWTNGTSIAKLQESDDDGSSDPYTDVAAADLLGAFAAIADGTNDNGNQRVGYIGIKRWIRGVLTESASPAPATGLVSGLEIVKSHPDVQPTA